MSFEDVVRSCKVLQYRKGLQALGNDSRKIAPSDSKMLSGSADIDSDFKSLYPNCNRWDYVVGYNEKAYFVEIHPCCTSEIKTMLKKIDWLKSFLKTHGSQLIDIKADVNYYWVASGKVDISPNSKMKRQLDDYNIKISSLLTLPPKN